MYNPRTRQAREDFICAAAKIRFLQEAKIGETQLSEGCGSGMDYRQTGAENTGI